MLWEVLLDRAIGVFQRSLFVTGNKADRRENRLCRVLWCKSRAAPVSISAASCVGVTLCRSLVLVNRQLHDHSALLEVLQEPAPGGVAF